MSNPRQPASAPQVWRVSPWARRGLLAGASVAALLGVAALAATIAAGPGGLPAVAVTWGMAWTFARIARYSTVHLTTDTVVIRNLFDRCEVPLTQLAAVEPGYYGLMFTTQDGTVHTALAVQKTNLWTWLGRRTRADAIAETILHAATCAANRATDAPPQPKAP